MLPIVGPGVVIDLLRLPDAALLSASHSDRDNARYQGWRSPLTEDEAAAFIAENATGGPPLAPGTAVQLAIRDHLAGPLVGDLYVDRSAGPPDQVEVGITLVPGAHGQGRATRAVAALMQALWEHAPGAPVQRIVAHVDEDNAASLALFTRLGFAVVERTSGASHRRDGTVGDEVTLAVTAAGPDAADPAG